MSQPLFQPTKQQEHCPQCGSPLQIKQGKKGLFLGCSAYPQCAYLKPLQPHSESKVLKELDQHCPECGHSLQLKQGHFGMFIGCSHYPACHFIVHDEDQQPRESFPCPECQQGHLVPRRGRQGKYFYACDQFPHCKFTLPTKPHFVSCPQCQAELSLIKKETAHQIIWQCANKRCQHSFSQEKQIEK